MKKVIALFGLSVFVCSLAAVAQQQRSEVVTRGVPADSCTGPGPCLMGSGGFVTDGGVTLAGPGNECVTWRLAGGDWTECLSGSDLVMKSGATVYYTFSYSTGRIDSAYGFSVGTAEGGGSWVGSGNFTTIGSIASTGAAGSTGLQLSTGQYMCANTGGAACWRALANDGDLEYFGTSVTVPALRMGATNTLGKVAMSNTAPALGTGWGTSPSIVANNGTVAFQINVGTGGTATNGSITLPAATTGWYCTCEDVTTISTTVARCRQTALGTTTSVNIGNYTSTDVAGAWVASDKILVTCMGY